MSNVKVARKSHKVRAIRKPIEDRGVTIRDFVIDPAQPIYFYVMSEYGPIVGRYEYLVTEGYETLDEAVDFAINVWGDSLQVETWIAVSNDLDLSPDVAPREQKGFFGN